MADFKFYLNRQGPKGEPGAKGEKGDNGNTPTFSDGINTPTVYTMQIDMGDGNVFETQNLKYPMRDDGGNYLRYDRTNSTVTLSAPNIADLQRTSGEVTLASVSDVENEEAQDTDAVSMELRNADQLVLDNEIERIDGDIDAVDNKVSEEIQNRQNADTQLTNKINTDVGNEATARSNADTALSGRIDGLSNSKANKSDVYTKTQTDSLLNGKANTIHTHTLSQITDAGSLAGKNTVDYSTEVTNKPTIGNGTITITQGGVTKGTFTTNQSGNSTIELDAGGGGGTTYTEGPGITINQDDEISVNVDNDTIIIDGNSLKANIPDVSNFVTDTQLADTLEAYPTNQVLSNLVDYETVTIPGQDSWVPLSLSNCRYDNPYSSTTSFDIQVTDYEAIGTLSKLNPGMVPGIEEIVQGNIVFQNNYRQAAYFKTRRLYFDRYALVTYFFVNGRLENGDTIQFDNTDIPSDIATYSNGYLDFYVDVYVTSFSVQYTFLEGYSDSFSTMIYGEPNESGGYLYNRVQGEPTVVTKAIIADTAVDGTTIDVDNNGQLTYIGTTGDTLPSQSGNAGKFLTTDGSVPSWATVSQPDMTQYYTKTQTDTLLDTKVTGGVVQYPLFYQPDTTSSVKLNNISPISLTGSADNGYTSDNNSLTNPVFNIKDFTNDDYKNVADYPELLDQPELCYAEYELKNGINTQFYSGGRSSSSGVYAGVAGYYDNESFIPTILLYPGCSSYTYYRHIVFTETPSVFTGGNSYQMSSSSTIMALGDDLTNCAASIVSNSGGSGWVIGFTTEEKELIDRSTHFRVMGIGTSQGATTTINLNTYKAVNPTFSEQWCPTSGGSSSTWAAYENSTNIFNVHPESLSLKYDSNTLGVNANNELYALSSTPSNMVTTNTAQTITGQKTFSSNLTVGNNGYGREIALCTSSSDGLIFGVNSSSQIYMYSRGSDKKIYNDGTTSWLLTSGMLDGTTIAYDNTTGKISVASSAPIRKTITQASANVSESSGTVTVTDVDVTTSTMVSLYPSDNTTETWLTNNLASNIITEGSGSFTFTINGTLPSTFSMYYIIQEVS